MTKKQRNLLPDGCTGIVEAKSKKEGHPLNVSPATSYDNYNAAMEAALKARAEGKEVILFSLEFMPSNPKKYKKGPEDYSGNPKDHIVRVTSPSIYIDENNVANYNYSLYDFNSGKWWEANNAENIGRGSMQIRSKTTNQVIYNSGFDAHIYSLIIR